MKRSDGVVEIIARSQRSVLRLFQNTDRQARRVLSGKGGAATKWSQGSNFRWFEVSAGGLLRLANWALAQAFTHDLELDGETIPAALERARKAKTQLQRDAYIHEANLAHAELSAQRELHEGELAAFNLNRPPAYSIRQPQPEPSIWNWQDRDTAS